MIQLWKVKLPLRRDWCFDYCFCGILNECCGLNDGFMFLVLFVSRTVLSINGVYPSRCCICAVISKTPLSDTEKCDLESKV